MFLVIALESAKLHRSDMCELPWSFAAEFYAVSQRSSLRHMPRQL